MKRSKIKATRSALEFAYKFGFLTRHIFFDFICCGSTATKYRNWKTLLIDRLFAESPMSKDILFLTRKGLAQLGGQAVKNRVYHYIPHDEIVAKMLLVLEKTNLTISSWTEGELKASNWDTISILGGENFEKLPDLVVDMKGSSRVVRIAVEVEATLKSRLRYDKIALSYRTMKNIDLIIFVTDSRAAELQIKRAFNSEVFRKVGKIPAFIKAKDFSTHFLESEVRIQDMRLTFKNFLAKVLQISAEQIVFKRESSENRFSAQKIEKEKSG